MTASRSMIAAGFVLSVVGLSLNAGAEEFSAESLKTFEQRVRPVLVEFCWECHGAKKQEAGLRLDARAAVFRGGDNGAVVSVGKPDQSLLLKAIRRTGDLKMPPERPLSDAAINAISDWIQSGLAWPTDSALSAISPTEAAKTHWAFQPVRKPEIPRVADSAWSRGPFDRFIISKQLEAGLSPSPEASRRELIRRVTFDLLGLPPSPDDVAEFETDESPDAFERLVDRLLANPRYGERWARHWLDVARYSDTKGYVFFEDKNYTWAYTYRDYVIESLNHDLPYDRFITEQLAADRLDLAGDPRPLRALGFLTLSPHFMGNTHDILDDRIDVVTRGLLGLSATCARCHDHKYDPISQRDYYGLYGVFRSSEEPSVPPLDAPPPETDAYRQFVAELQKREAALREFVNRKHQELVNGARTRVSEYLTAAHAARHQPPTDDFMLIADPNDLNPTMVLRWRVFLEKVGRQPHPVWRPWSRLAAIPDAQFAELAAAELAKVLAEDDTVSPLNARVRSRLAGLKPQSMSDVAAAYAELLKQVDHDWREQLAAATKENRPAPVKLDDAAAEELRAVLYGPDAPPDVPVLLGWGFLTLLPDRASQGEYQKLLKEVEAHLTTGAGAPSRALALQDAAQPYEARVFLRGNPNRLGEAAPRQFLAAVNPQRKPFTDGSGRLELAREITQSSNPLTVRVLVNRVWLHHFGAGIVRTPSDFGLRGESPTHPELLDHLSAEFVERGWSIKQLHRQLVASATYRQASVDRSEAVTADPDNRRWWRMNARRLDFETFRDALLAVADRMEGKIGGPSQPLLGEAVVPRRTLYGFIDRLDVPTLLTTFDFPNPSQSNPQRDQTTVPLQSLFLMNNNFMAEISRRVTERPDVTSPSDTHLRIQRLFRTIYSRDASRDEIERVQAFIGSQPSPTIWQQLIHAMLMTNEFAFID